jgi:hypothetical protein
MVTLDRVLSQSKRRYPRNQYQQRAPQYQAAFGSAAGAANRTDAAWEHNCLRSAAADSTDVSALNLGSEVGLMISGYDVD